MGRKLLADRRPRSSLVRIATIVAYRDTLYYYGMVAHQFAIAEAAYHGHWFAHDRTLLRGGRCSEAKRQGRHIPLEEWAALPRSGRYTTFPAADLPGLGYLIAFTSRWFDDHLTTRYAHGASRSLVEAGQPPACSPAAPRWSSACARAFLDRARLRLRLSLHLADREPADARRIRPRRVRDASSPPRSCSCGREAARVWLVSALLLAVGSLLLWVRPHGYYFFLVLRAPRRARSRRRSLRERAAFASLLVLIPWLVFGYPLRLFNLRHYGVAETDAVGLALWEQLGIVPGQPLRLRASGRGDAALGQGLLREGRRVRLAGDEPTARRVRPARDPRGPRPTT